MHMEAEGSSPTAVSAAMPTGSTSVARMVDTVSRMPPTNEMSVMACVASAKTPTKNACAQR